MIRWIALAAFWIAGLGPAAAAIEVQEVTSPGGIKAWLVEEHSIPFTALEIRFRGGSALDEAGKRGATYLMTATLEEGAADMDARAFAERVESLAASFRFNVYDDVLAISARFLTENSDQAVDLLKSAIMQPRFDQDAIDRVRGQIQAVLLSETTNPRNIAGQAFNAATWGDHPYATNAKGTPESLDALTREDLISARNRVLARDRLYVAAVGDISANELGLLLDHLLGDLPQTSVPLPPGADYQLAPGETVIDFATPQSLALFGHKGIKRNDPDYMAAYVVNEIFGGGGFQSRLMEEVREKRGLTYGIGVSLLPMEFGELVLGQVQSDNTKMAEAINLVRQEWQRIGEHGVTEAELQDAKTYLTGAYALRFDGNAPIARIMVGMQMTGLPVDYIRTRNDQLTALTLEEVNRLAGRLYRADQLHFFVVGQPVGLSADQ